MSQPSTSSASPQEEITSSSAVVTSSGENSQGNGQVLVSEAPRWCSVNTRRFVSVAYFAFIIIIAVIVLVAATVHTDKKGIGIDPLSLYRCLAVFLLISILWMATFIFSKVKWCSKLFDNRWFASPIRSDRQLLPQRLLAGVMIFGLGSSFMTMVELLKSIAVLTDCPSKDPSMCLYYVVRILFIYTQLYFFYKLSCNTKKVLIFAHGLMMHLIAVNLATWIVTFVHDSAEEAPTPTGKTRHTPTNSTQEFMTHHWDVVLGSNHSLVNISKNCHDSAKVLESTAKSMEPILYVFTMEYCLISAGLLLNTWRLLPSSAEGQDNGGFEDPEGLGNGHTRQASGQKESVAIKKGRLDGKEKMLKKKKSKSSIGHSDKRSISEDTEEFEVITAPEGMPEVGTLWRFGFILGFAYIPAFTAIVVNMFFSDDKEQDRLIYIGMQFIFFLSILIASVIGIIQLKKQDVARELHSNIDYILLFVALIGVFFLDLFIIVAGFCEWSQSPTIAAFLIVANITELLCSIAFTLFVREALKHELPAGNADERRTKSASKIREVVSFLFMLNLCFWALYTFEVKRSNLVFDTVETFYTPNVWFYLSHFVYPFAVFFHFHGAVCMVEILNHFSISKSRTEPGLASASMTTSHPGNIQT